MRRPVDGALEYNDAAVAALYDMTAGHPYFTRVICQSILELAVRRRDGYITPIEVNEAFSDAVRTSGSHYFQHFWEDGIADTPDRAELASINRRKVLMAIAEVVRHNRRADPVDVLGQASRLGLSSTEAEVELQDFVRRQVLAFTGNQYSCKVRFFQEWLKEYGVSQILAKFTEAGTPIRIMEEDERLRVRSDEIVSLTRAWRTYRGQPVETDHVRAWLEQFGDARKQRLMFKLLQGVRYYSRHLVRERLREAHGMVMRGVVQHLAPRQRKRPEVLVSYLDGAGKSGALFAKWYGEENRILSDNIVEPLKIEKILASNPDIQAILFVDDFIGTGNSICRNLEAAADPLMEASKDRGVLVKVLAVCGFEPGVEAIRIPRRSVGWERRSLSLMRWQLATRPSTSSQLSILTRRNGSKRMSLPSQPGRSC